MKCPKCGANVEITLFEDGTLLIRQDCQCKLPDVTSIAKSIDSDNLRKEEKCTA